MTAVETPRSFRVELCVTTGEPTAPLVSVLASPASTSVANMSR